MGFIQYIVNNAFIPLLKLSYAMIPNYGVAIIFLTLLIKLIFYPLTYKQFKSMKINQKLQPEVKRLQEKFKDDPQQAHKAVMALWKEHNANPFLGCLPTLIQLPFFFAIFWTIKSPAFAQLLSMPGVNPGLFSFWISNLSLPDKTFILPVVIGIATYFSQKMFMTDPKQAALFMFMPFVMVFICLKMPGGVLIYWATSQVISTAQQFLIMRKHQD